MSGSLFGRKTDKARLDEAMALQVAKLIINDVTTTTTRSRDPASQGRDPDCRGHDPASSQGASLQL